jgi:predicted nucleotidyltransferase
MRLSQNQINTFLDKFYSIFGEGQIYLFGSRVDDSKRGGDIDLYLNPTNRTDLFQKKIKFLARVKREIGDQKIDIVFNEDSNRLIEKEALKDGIQLKR